MCCDVTLGVIGSIVALVTPLALLAAPRSETVALIGRPGSDSGDVIRVVAEAGGSVLNVGRRPGVVIARSDSAGFVGRLYAAGAGLVLDGTSAGGCGGAGPATAITRTANPDLGHPER